MATARFSLTVAFLIILFVVILLLPQAAEAAMFVSGDAVMIGPDETVDDDVYLFGETVTLGGTVHGDAFIFAREAVVDGTVRGSLLIFAETVRVNGEIEGTIRGGANTVIFQGRTSRDMMMMANTVSMGGQVEGDLLAAAGSVTVNGPVGRDIRASVNRLVVDAPVGGEIRALVSDLVIGPEASISGDVTYTSENEASVDSGAVVGGSLERLEPAVEVVTASPGRSAWSFIRPILSILAVTLVMVLLFPRLTAGAARTIGDKPGLSIGIGVLVVFAAPFAVLILLITVIGLPISLLSMLLYIVLIYLTRVFAGFFLGKLIFDRIGREPHPVWVALGGVLALALLVKIPYVGWLIHLAAVLFAAGAFFVYTLGSVKIGDDQKTPETAEEL